MTFSLFQMDVAWLDPQANLDKVAQAAQATQTDILVLPEMFNTGFIMQPKLHAEDIHGNTLNALHQIASDHSLYICGTIPLHQENDKYTNSFIGISPQGLQWRYDKMHLFNLSGEGQEYTAGIGTKNVRFNDWTIRPLICYDLRFPYASTNHNGQVDVIIYSANWPISRIDHWRKLLVARAIENQCFVIGVNRVGSDGNGLTYNGNSLVIDYTGKIIAEVGEDEAVVSINLQKEDMMIYRRALPFLKDMRKEQCI